MSADNMPTVGIASEKHQRFRKPDVYRTMLRVFGGPEWGGIRAVPPADHIEFHTSEGDYVSHDAFVGDDGHTLNLSYHKSDQVAIALRAKPARQLAWFILWHWWAKGTWFGFRQRIWYWALSRSIERRDRYTGKMHSVAKIQKQLEARLAELEAERKG